MLPIDFNEREHLLWDSTKNKQNRKKKELYNLISKPFFGLNAILSKWKSSTANIHTLIEFQLTTWLFNKLQIRSNHRLFVLANESVLEIFPPCLVVVDRWQAYHWLTFTRIVSRLGWKVSTNLCTNTTSKEGLAPFHKWLDTASKRAGTTESGDSLIGISTYVVLEKKNSSAQQIKGFI